MNKDELSAVFEGNLKAHGDWDAIRQMCATEGWAVAAQIMSKKRKQLLDSLAREVEEPKIRILQGSVQAYDWFLRLPELAERGLATAKTQMEEADRLLSRNGVSAPHA